MTRPRDIDDAVRLTAAQHGVYLDPLVGAEPIADQPPPFANTGPAIADLVIADMRERKALGIQRYGTPLQAHNGRDALVDLYQELLDACCYVRQAIEEREPDCTCQHQTARSRP